MHRVRVNGELMLVEDGELLSNALMEAGKGAEHPCGGRGTCKKCTVLVDGKEQLSCQYRIRSDVTVLLPDKDKIISEVGAEETGKLTQDVCFVLDIGTTTLVLALVSLEENKIIKTATRTNPQRAFGADVMTRIDFCRKHGVKKLQEAILSEVNSMLLDFGSLKAEKLYVSGNIAMLHMFFGVDCSAMGAAPYTPVFLGSKCGTAVNLGLSSVDVIESLPSIAAFVGADLVAGLNLVGMPESGKYNLLVDLGTNAEVVLFSEKAVVCTAAAAGPCFEGANISCGMTATNGAIYSYAKDRIKTVGDVPARGICGTGLVDIIAELVADETIDETGFMECEKFEVSDEVFLSQADVRQFQTAKSAICSAILTLMEIQGTAYEDIANVYVSGGFSAKINIANAVKTGLFPKELCDKCVMVNNSSLLGTVKYAYENNDLSVYLERAEYVDLSADPFFSDLFIENMLF